MYLLSRIVYLRLNLTSVLYIHNFLVVSIKSTIKNTRSINTTVFLLLSEMLRGRLVCCFYRCGAYLIDRKRIALVFISDIFCWQGLL